MAKTEEEKGRIGLNSSIFFSGVRQLTGNEGWWKNGGVAPLGANWKWKQNACGGKNEGREAAD